MGIFSVAGRLTGPTGVSEAVELVVDSGATLLVVPKPLADRLALEPQRVQRVRVAGGRVEEWPVAEARLGLEGREITTPCFISPAGPALLGAVALESLFLGVDPVGKRLLPVEGYVLFQATRRNRGGEPEESRAPQAYLSRPPWAPTPVMDLEAAVLVALVVLAVLALGAVLG